MSTNPFIEEMEALQQEFGRTRKELEQLTGRLAWFQSFNLERASINLRQAERIVADAQRDLDQVERARSASASKIQKLEEEVSLGFDPRRWFSSERSIAKRELENEKNQMSTLAVGLSKATAKHAKASGEYCTLRAEVEAARTFDPLHASSAIPALSSQLDRMRPQLELLKQQSDRLDAALKDPVANLRELEANRSAMLRQISRAEMHVKTLDAAVNSYQKAMAHKECEREFGQSRPGVVIQQIRGRLRGVDANIKKSQDKIAELVRFAKNKYEHIVIDGNNLCYEQGNRFHGLAALEAIVPVLAQSLKVTLIFDDSIRRGLGMQTEEICRRFPEADRVHIVSSKTAADEIVLAVANDPRVVVLSNDKFDENRHRPAVKEKRVIRHDILRPVACIPALQLEVAF